jgi:hypothetical protein
MQIVHPIKSPLGFKRAASVANFLPRSRRDVVNFLNLILNPGDFSIRQREAHSHVSIRVDYCLGIVGGLDG